MNKNEIEKKVFSYKVLRMIMMLFGSFMIAVGSMYAYFIVDTLGFEATLNDELFPFIMSIIAVPAGIFVSIIGVKLKKPILHD